MKLKKETLEKIDAVIPRYPQKRSAALPVLHCVQADQGYISNNAIEWIAEKLELQPINIYELVTFYPFFRQKPIGQKYIRVCRTLPCALRGAYKTCSVLQEALNCPLNETSKDESVTIEFAECLASCGTGPVVMVDEQLHENVNTENAQKLANTILEEKETAS